MIIPIRNATRGAFVFGGPVELNLGFNQLTLKNAVKRMVFVWGEKMRSCDCIRMNTGFVITFDRKMLKLVRKIDNIATFRPFQMIRFIGKIEETACSFSRL